MKHSLLSFLICLLLLAPLGTVVSTSTQPTPPGPAYAPQPLALTKDTSTAKPFTPKPITQNDLIIDIISNVNEDLYMGYLESLESLGPRPTGSGSCEAAAAYILGEFQNDSLWAHYCPWNNGGYDSDNIEATINGTNSSSNDIYIICAHYDTVSAGPGADDDTSGTVAVLTAAYLLSQYTFDYTIKFVSFSGEEEGLLGSAVYAQEAKQQGWNIVGVLNCDMISYAISTSDGNQVFVIENTASEWLYTYTVAVNAEYADYIGPLTLVHYGYMWGSDYNSFYDQGYDAMFYLEYHETPYYHTSSDNMDHINATYAAKNIRMIIATLCELGVSSLPSNPPSQPTLQGQTMGAINISYVYKTQSTDPDNDMIYYNFNWGDGTSSGWMGPYNSGVQASCPHSWSHKGVYVVKVKAKDTHGASSAWSVPLSVTITDNFPPNPPVVTGPASVKPFHAYTYTVSAVDVQGQKVKFDVDWGDGHATSGIGPYNSGQLVNLTHSWHKKGTYTIKVRAVDTLGAKSNWTTVPISVPLDYHPSILKLLLDLFQHTRFGDLLQRLLNTI